MMHMNEKKPVKARNLKIIDYKGIHYATFDGEKMWEMDRLISRLIMEFDGVKTFDDIAKKISKKSGLNLDEVKEGLKPIFDELEKKKFIEWI